MSHYPVYIDMAPFQKHTGEVRTDVSFSPPERFFHQERSGDSFISICSLCGEVVGVAERISALRHVEARHICEGGPDQDTEIM